MINPKGINARLVASLDRYFLVSSAAIVEEVAEVLFRPEVLGVTALRKLDAQRLVELLGRAPLVSPTVAVTICRDPDDKKFLEAAIAAGAEYVVTGDKDLRSLDACALEADGRVGSACGASLRVERMCFPLGHPWGTLTTVRGLWGFPSVSELAFEPPESRRIVGEGPRQHS